MARNRSHTSTERRSTINLRLLLIALFVLGGAGGAAFFVHRSHVRKNADALLKRSQESLDKGEKAEAVQWLLQYLQLKPEDHEAHVRLAELFDKTAESLPAKTAAIDHYTRAIGFFPSRVALRARKAELLLETGRFGDAVSEANQMLDRYAGHDDAKAHYIKAMGLYRQMQQAKASIRGVDAIGSLKTALTANPGHPELASALADVLHEYSDPPRPSEAVAVLDEMVSHKTDSAAAYLARHQYRAKYELTGAEDDLKRALALAPNDVDVLLAKGDAEIAAGAYAEAIRTYRRISEDQASKDRRGHIGLARAYAANGNRADAVKVLQQAIENVDRNDLMFHLLLARVWIDDVREKQEDGNTAVEQSLKEIRDLLRRLASNLTENQYGRIADGIDTLEAEYLLVVRKPAKAVSLLEKAAQSTSRSFDFQEDRLEMTRRWSLLGDAYAALQYWDLAAQAFREAAKLQVNSPQAEVAVAVALHNAGRPDQAIERYRSALLSPKAPQQAWHLLARAELHKQLRVKTQRDWGPFQRALRDAKNAVRDSAELLLVEAEGLAAQGDPKQAADLLPKAIAMDPARVLPVAAVAYERWGDPVRADAALVELQRLSESQFATAYAETRVRRNEFAAAIDALLKAVATANPREAAELLGRAAEIELSRSDLDAARNRLRRSFEIHPHSPWPLQRLGDLAIQTRDIDDLKYCEQQLRSLEGDGSALWRFFRAIRLLIEHPEAGQPVETSKVAAASPPDEIFSEVTQMAEFLARTRASWPASHHLAGIVAERAGKFDKAAADYQRAVDLGSYNLTLYERLVSLLYMQNRAEEAAQYLDRLQDSLYASTKLWALERTSLVQAARFVELAESAERAARVRPKGDVISKVWLGHARALAAENEREPQRQAEWYKKAEEAFREATLGDGAKDFRSWAGWVWYHARRKQADEARKALKNMEQFAKLDVTELSLALAQGYYLIGDLREAERFFDQAVKASPRNVAVLERRARFYFATSPAKAEEAYENLHTLDRNKNAYRTILAALWASSGDKAKFQKAMELLSSESPQDGAPQQVANQRMRAIFLIQRGEADDIVEALRLLKQLVDEAADPGVLDRLLLAQLYEREKKPVEAQQQYEQIVRGDAPNAAYLEAYLYFLLRHDKQADFQKQLRRLESMESEKASLRLVRLKCQWIKHISGKGQASAGEVRNLLDQFQAAGLAQAKTNEQRARVWLNVAALYDELGLEPQADAAFRRFLDQKLTDNAYRNYASWLVQKGRFADAMRACQTYGGKDASPEAAALLSTILAAAMGRVEPPAKEQQVSTRDAEAAELRIEAMLRQHPDHRQLLFSVGALRHIQSRKKEALALYRRLVDLHGDDVLGLNNLALILSEEPQLRNEAISCINQALQRVPRSVELRDSLGLVLLNTGQSEQALEVFNEVVSKQKQNCRYLFHFAIAKFRLGDLEAARRALAEAKNLKLAEEILTPHERRDLNQLEVELAKSVRTSRS
jgi:tetratricopeptide (TPR) repeat protein